MLSKKLIRVVSEILINLVCVLKPKVLLATNPGGGKLVLLASSEMEQDFLKLQALYNPFLSFLEC